MTVLWRLNYMNIEYKLFPYPVLNYFSDDYKNSAFISELEIDMSFISNVPRLLTETL